MNHWGRRQLAYQIGRRDIRLLRRCELHRRIATALPEYERAIKLDDGVVRYLITLFEHEVGAPPMSEEEIAARQQRRDSDDDDDEE